MFPGKVCQRWETKEKDAFKNTAQAMIKSFLSYSVFSSEHDGSGSRGSEREEEKNGRRERGRKEGRQEEREGGKESSRQYLQYYIYKY